MERTGVAVVERIGVDGKGMERIGSSGTDGTGWECNGGAVKDRIGAEWIGRDWQ